MTTPTETPGTATPNTGMVAMDAAGRIQIPRAAAITAAFMRISLGFVYLWAFISQGFGITYSNQATPAPGSSPTAPADYGWHFAVDSSKGWISSGFKASPTSGFVSSLHGPLAFIPQHLATGIDDFGWMLALAGLGIALMFGVFSTIAGWGGLILNLLIWLSSFPPSTNPLIDAEHVTFALAIFLMMWIQASNYWGFGRWWRSHTPTLLH
ncbi:thiosulfate dehydrogenase [quinone] large subunit [Frankineae bacterium MT45]|nr:thiosulfate dehydrogenase [quinone] large subunit [Frankineae bacterium MT45]